MLILHTVNEGPSSSSFPLFPSFLICFYLLKRCSLSSLCVHLLSLSKQWPPIKTVPSDSPLISPSALPLSLLLHMKVILVSHWHSSHSKRSMAYRAAPTPVHPPPAPAPPLFFFTLSLSLAWHEASDGRPSFGRDVAQSSKARLYAQPNLPDADSTQHSYIINVYFFSPLPFIALQRQVSFIGCLWDASFHFENPNKMRRGQIAFKSQLVSKQSPPVPN